MDSLKQYTINSAEKTRNQADLVSGFELHVMKTVRDKDTYLVTVVTCISGEENPTEHWEKTSEGVLSYDYDPSPDNAKTELVLLTEHLEDNLTEWVGASNWTTP